MSPCHPACRAVAPSVGGSPCLGQPFERQFSGSCAAKSRHLGTAFRNSRFNRSRTSYGSRAIFPFRAIPLISFGWTDPDWPGLTRTGSAGRNPDFSSLLQFDPERFSEIALPTSALPPRKIAAGWTSGSLFKLIFDDGSDITSHSRPGRANAKGKDVPSYQRDMREM